MIGWIIASPFLLLAALIGILLLCRVHLTVRFRSDQADGSGSLELSAVNAAAAATDLDTVVGHVAFNADHVAVMSCVTGQWIRNEDGTYRQEIVGNCLMPAVARTAELVLIPERPEKEDGE